jgi:hypothetical protein
LGTLPHGKIYLIVTNKGLGYIFGDFFTNSSGHPAQQLLYRINRKKGIQQNMSDSSATRLPECQSNITKVCPHILVMVI